MNEKVREIFTNAAVLPPGDERENYLAEACGDDAELRLEVQRLLVDAERADSFLGATVVDDDEIVADEALTILDGDEGGGGFSESAGDVVGPYTGV